MKTIIWVLVIIIFYIEGFIVGYHEPAGGLSTTLTFLIHFLSGAIGIALLMLGDKIK